MTCPKCGHATWLGPIYLKGIPATYEEECLLFKCEQCGYLRYEGCLDRKEEVIYGDRLIQEFDKIAKKVGGTRCPTCGRAWGLPGAIPMITDEEPQA